MRARKSEGLQHLLFALSLAELQLSLGGRAHLENPLGSTAWRQKQAVLLFSKAPWLSARFHQCAFNLRVPEGALRKKPSLVKTTDPAMQTALQKLCDNSHPHELVQGSATSLSEQYPVRLANAIARVVMGGEIKRAK